MPWGIVLELHGWWHILTSISAYTFMSMIEFLTCPEDVDTHGVGFAWPAKVVLGDLVSQGEPSVDANGDVGKKAG
jgi:dihydroceramidase